MLYITDSPKDLVKYHIKKQYQLTIGLHECSASSTILEVLGKGTAVKQSLNLIDAIKLTKTELNRFSYKQSRFNISYLLVSSAVFKEAEQKFKGKLHIKCIRINRDLYKGNLIKLKGLFDEEAYEWIWDKFGNDPHKLDMELMRLLLSLDGKKYTKRSLLELYDSGGRVDAYRYNIGTVRGTQILKEMSDKEIWTLMIGSDKAPPFLYRVLVEDKSSRIPVLYHHLLVVREAIQEGYIGPRIGCLLFNEWVRSLKIPKGTTDLTLTVDQIQRLNRLIRG